MAVLGGGPTDAKASELDRPENAFEVNAGGLLEVYTDITSPEGEPLLFEVYYAAGEVAARQREILAPSGRSRWADSWRCWDSPPH
jgi:two-component system NarL family sensor kinase